MISGTEALNTCLQNGLNRTTCALCQSLMGHFYIFVGLSFGVASESASEHQSLKCF